MILARKDKAKANGNIYSYLRQFQWQAGRIVGLQKKKKREKMKVFVKGIIHFLITKLFAWRVRPGKLLSLHLEMENSR